MTAPERNLVAALRAELAAIDPVRLCDRIAEAIGLGPDLVTREPAVARLAVRLDRQVRGRARPGRDGAREEIGAAERETGRNQTEDLPEPAAFDWAGSAEHCRTAFLRGRFLARGSLSIASARTHLEFVVSPDEAPLLARRLGESGLPASWRIRRGKGVVTWKSAETVGTFLRRIGAGASLLELEARQVSRSVRGDLNRILNAESANLQRAVAAASRQLEAIEILGSDGRLAEQPYVVRLVAAARQETPEATLTELAERLEIHRSAAQRALERLERLALHDDRDEAPRWASAAAGGGPGRAGEAGWPGSAVRTARREREDAAGSVPSGSSRSDGPLA